MFQALLFFAGMCCNMACGIVDSNFTLADNGRSNFTIVIPAEASKAEKHAAQVFQQYLKQISGLQLPLTTEASYKGKAAVYIGKVEAAGRFNPKKIEGEGFIIATDNDNLYITGGTGQGVVYGVYAFLEKYLNCKKLYTGKAIVPQQKKVYLTAGILDKQITPFVYRQVYYPASNDAEYMEWHGLHKFEDLWGIWGHSFFKLVPPQDYFKPHPEYFALVDGKRQATQLCLSNEDVFKITVENLKKRFAQNPDAEYWSVSINDDLGYCTCDKCKKTDAEEGGPQGSLIRFVNRIAKTFPDKKFTTLAYLYTSHPSKTKPESNVIIMLSDIDAYRTKPLTQESSAASFRRDLEGWAKMTKQIFIWDYTTQFTNYLAPFPDLDNLQANVQYLQQQNVKGIFSQGSGDTYSELAELRSYLLSYLLWNPAADIAAIKKEFLDNYYGAAATSVQQYIDRLQAEAKSSKRKIDIYGNPINEYDSYLSPELIDQYSTILDKAEAAVEKDTVLLNRVNNVRLSLDYTVLQQSKFFGQEKFGYLQGDGKNSYVVKPNWAAKISRFVAQAKKAGVTELSEGSISPDDYQKEWNTILAKPFKANLAYNAKVTLANPLSEDFPAKKERTLVDNVNGYTEFSYNWLLFYGADMIATVDLGAAKSFTNVDLHFLEDQRHWIFLPTDVTVETSDDGVKYTTFGTKKLPAPDEIYSASINTTSFSKKTTARYVRVTAKCLGSLPVWRFRQNRKPSLACDEILLW